MASDPSASTSAAASGSGDAARTSGVLDPELVARRQEAYKARGGRGSDQARRREEQLRRQKQASESEALVARRDLAEHARELAASATRTSGAIGDGDSDSDGADGAADSMDACDAQAEATGMDAEATGGSGGRGGRRRGRGGPRRGPSERELARMYSQQLMIPEWINEVPQDLRERWLVAARPEGRRCLVIASAGKTVSRLRSGALLARFPSALPGGRRGPGGDGYSILDCVYHEADATYYVLDLMCWRGYSLYDCDTEFRFFWLHTKLAECAGLGEAGPANRHRFVPLPYHAADAPGLEAAYRGSWGYGKDGLLFVHRAAHYELGVTPLALMWKDAACCRYFDDPRSALAQPLQIVTLAVGEGAALLTGDDPPVPLGALPPALLASPEGAPLRPGHLVRVTITGAAELPPPPGSPPDAGAGRVVGDLRFHSRLPPGKTKDRVLPDVWSKILFYHSLRHDPLAYGELAAAAAGVGERMQADSDPGPGGPPPAPAPAPEDSMMSH
eukprot:tig00000073_g1684.t1